MTALRLDDLRQHSDVLRLRSGKSLTVRFVEPRDAEALQDYFRSLTTRSRYNRFLGAMSELPHNRARAFRPCRRGRPLQRDRDHDDRRHETIVGEARYAFDPGNGSFEFGLSIDDRWQGQGIGTALLQQSGMPRRRVRCHAPVRRHPALQRRHDRAGAQIRLCLHHNPDDWKLVRFEKHIDIAPKDIPCASWRLAAEQISLQAALAS